MNTTTAGVQQLPAVAATQDGGYVVIWLGLRAAGKFYIGQRYDSNGNPSGSEFIVVNASTSSDSLRRS